MLTQIYGMLIDRRGCCLLKHESLNFIGHYQLISNEDELTAYAGNICKANKYKGCV